MRGKIFAHSFILWSHNYNFFQFLICLLTRLVTYFLIHLLNESCWISSYHKILTENFIWTFRKLFQKCYKRLFQTTWNISKKPEACNFIKQEALAQVFSCEFCKIFKNTFLCITPPVVASVHAELKHWVS